MLLLERRDIFSTRQDVQKIATETTQRRYFATVAKMNQKCMLTLFVWMDPHILFIIVIMNATNARIQYMSADSNSIDVQLVFKNNSADVA